MNRLPKKMIGGSFKFSDLLKGKKTPKKTNKKKGEKRNEKRNEKRKDKRKEKVKGDPSSLGYSSNKTNLNIIIKGSDGNLYKNKKYKKTKRWQKISKR